MCNRVTQICDPIFRAHPPSYISSKTPFIFAYVPAGMWQLSTLQISTQDTLKSTSANCLAIKTSITQQLQCLLIKQLLAVIQMTVIRLIIFQAPFHATLWLSLATILAFTFIDIWQRSPLGIYVLVFTIWHNSSLPWKGMLWWDLFLALATEHTLPYHFN